LSLALPIPDDFLDALTERVLVHLNHQPARKLLSKDSLAEHYGVRPRTIKTWRERGLKAYKEGRDLYFDVQETDRWLKRRGLA
jgi:hypothetical protein